MRGHCSARVTPFLLMGSMSPVPVPSGRAAGLGSTLRDPLFQTLARARRSSFARSCRTRHAVWLASFGTPESCDRPALHGTDRAVTTGCRSGRWRLTSSQTVELSGVRSSDTLWATFSRGTNFVMHSARLARFGLVSLLREKFVVDVRVALCCTHLVPAAAINEESSPTASTRKWGQGGHFSRRGAHLERFPRMLLPSAARRRPRTTSGWSRLGGKDAAARASRRLAKTLEDYGPALDQGLKDAFSPSFDRRRNTELGDRTSTEMFIDGAGPLA